MFRAQETKRTSPRAKKQNSGMHKNIPEQSHSARKTFRAFQIFFHPDYNCRLRNHTESCLAARGLYHR